MRNYVLVSVSDKSNILPFVCFLYEKDYTILSTGGTYQHIYDNLINVRDRLVQVSDFTGFEEILGGRVKTLHPKIYGGLLWDDKFDCAEITKIDTLIVNLYPFEDVIAKEDTTEELAIENIDIGGVSLIRAAAKNFKNVRLVVDPMDYQNIMENWDDSESYTVRRQFAVKGFDLVTRYDASITNYFNKDIVFRRYEKQKSLKYGCNPYQDNAAIYTMNSNQIPFSVLNGNPGYINLLDAINSWLLVVEVEKTIGQIAASSFKHTSPAGVAIANGIISDIDKTIYDIENYDLTNSPTGEAFIKARNGDPVSSFGDFISISGVVDETCARLIAREVSDGIIAEGYTVNALEILKKKKKGNYIILEGKKDYKYKEIEFREIMGFGLSQRANSCLLTDEDFKNIVTDTKDLTQEIKDDLILATITLKYTPSNSIAISKGGIVIGVGAGQQNRVDCIKLAGRKSIVWRLRRHPKVLELYGKFKACIKRQDKTNALTKYINGDFSDTELLQWKELFTDMELGQWRELFTDELDMLSQNEKKIFLDKGEISLSSDAFMPFRDNVDNAIKFNVKNIIQPGGSVADGNVINACDEYGILMVFSGKRFFLH